MMTSLVVPQHNGLTASASEYDTSILRARDGGLKPEGPASCFENRFEADSSKAEPLRLENSRQETQ
jgi:hypothetical protein